MHHGVLTLPTLTAVHATEILTVLEGSLEVGFVTSNPQNLLITKVLQKGDVFVFPIGLIHYQRNVGNGNVIAIAALSSQNPGVNTIANAVFGSKPHIPSDILMKAFQAMKHGCISGFGCGCRNRQFLKKVGCGCGGMQQLKNY